MARGLAPRMWVCMLGLALLCQPFFVFGTASATARATTRQVPSAHTVGTDTSSQSAPSLSELQIDRLIQPVETPDQATSTAAAQAARSVAPTPADLAATTEVQLTPEIRTLARSLNRSPLKIYQYIRNGFEFEPYYGSLKGATATLWTQAGNDYDLASLTLALLRASNIPSRYVIGTVTIPTHQVNDWLGVTSSLAARDYLRTAGIPAETIMVNGRVAGLRIEHVWVVAYLANGSSNATWVALDPSFKLKRYQTGIDLPRSLGFERDAYLASVQSRLPSELYQEQVQNYLRSKVPGKNLADVPYHGQIIPATSSQLPQELPYRVNAITGEYTAVPDSLRHKIAVRLDILRSATLIPTTTLTLPQIALNSVSLTFVGTGTAQRPVLSIDGTPLITGTLSCTCNTHELRLGFIEPKRGTVRTTAHQIKAGSYALAIDARQLGERFLAERMTRVLDLAAARGQPGVQKTRVISELLHLAGIRYFHRVNESAVIAQGLTHYVQARSVAVAVLSASGTTVMDTSLAYGIRAPGMTIDVARLEYAFFGQNGDNSRAPELMRLHGMSTSALEHQIWEEIVEMPAISTVKVLQLAREQGIPIYTLTAATLEQYRARLNLGPTLNRLVAELANGKTITIPGRFITYHDWHGVGWISENPLTGAAAYIITVDLNGGTVACKEPQRCQQPTVPTTLGQPCVECRGNQTSTALSNGNNFQQFDDIAPTARGAGLRLTRSYNAQSTTSGSFGNGWTHTYERRLVENPVTGTVLYIDEFGGEHTFIKRGVQYSSPIELNRTLMAHSQGFSLRDTAGTVENYTSAGLLVRITTTAGDIQALSYAPSGRLAQVVATDGTSLQFEYNATGTITAIRDFAGQVWSYRYDTNGNLLAATRPITSSAAVATTTYTYYAQAPWQHRIKTIVAPSGETTSFTYYVNGRVFQIGASDGTTTTFRYLPLRGETEVVDAQGITAVFRSDADGIIMAVSAQDDQSGT